MDVFRIKKPGSKKNIKKSLPYTKRSNAGFTVVFSAFLILAIGLVMVLSAGYIGLNDIKMVRNSIYSIKSHYIAESGIEDSLVRLRRGINFSQNNNLTVDGGSATIEISDSVGGSRTIISTGNFSERIRKSRVVYAIKTDNISFFYGAQAGDGGITMENNSRIRGNVFSNGSIVGLNGKGYIDYTAKVATIGNEIEGLIIGGDAYTHNCKNCTIAGSLYFSGGGQENCTASSGIKEHPVEEKKSLPISEEQIIKWKNDALQGGVFENNYTVGGGVSDSLGPKKIVGNLILQNNSTLIINGTLWVTGNIEVNNNAILKLSNDYGSTSGIVVADGRIAIKSGAQVQGSGVEGSYIMLLSTNASIDFGLPAVDVVNTARGAIFYASRGMIRLRNNMFIREATGYKLYLDNNAVIEYEVGLEDTAFSSGPGGSWEITTWREIE